MLRPAVPDPDPQPDALRPRDGPSLVRALGRWDLLALVINGILGAGIFGLPGKVHALLGVYGLAAIVVCAAIIALVVVCFAEVSSRFTQTAGPFVYASAAFGPLLGFLTGWVMWIARVTGCCAICALLLQYLAYISPPMNQGAGRFLTVTAIFGGLTVIHVQGIRRAASFGNLVTIAKLAPLFLFVGIGLLHIDWSRLQHSPVPLNTNFAEAVLLLTFAFVGWENTVVAAGEMRDPQQDLPRALITGLAIVAVLYGLIQLVCIGTLPGLATSERPLVDAAGQFLGPAGALLITLGAAVSMLGNLNAAMLTISRLPYAMAAAGQLPRALAVIHPRFRTPYVALIFSGLLMLANLAAARFVLPGGLAIPSAAIALIAWLLASSSFAATRDVAILTLIGALLYAIGRRHERQSVT